MCFREWLSIEDTTYAGAWLADIRRPPPLDLRYWRLPHAAKEDWLSDTQDLDTIAESVTEDGRLILASHREIITYEFGGPGMGGNDPRQVRLRPFSDSVCPPARL